MAALGWAFCGALGTLSADPVADYLFEGNLSSAVAGAPDLEYLPVASGANPQYLGELFPSGNESVLRFERGDGLLLPGFTELAGTSYTLIATFRFDETSSWRRIFDFKDGSSDWGLYGYNGRLQFYAVATGSEAVVKSSEYSEVALTRDESGTVRGYVDGVLQFTFNDSSGHALVNANDVLVLFRDDRVVRNEHTSGRIARFRVYNYAVDGETLAGNVPDLTVRFGGGSIDRGDGWRESAWFGYFNEYLAPPWIFSEELGWMYANVNQDGTFFLYFPHFAWIWSSEEFYPYIYGFDQSSWFYYWRGYAGAIWVNLSTNQSFPFLE